MSLFSFFNKKKKFGDYEPIQSYSAFATDIHSHLIPGIDDGVQSIEESLEMIRGLSALGFRKLITTPHVMSDGYRNTADIILAGLKQVQDAVAAENIPVTVQAAAEYYFDEGFFRKLESEKLLAINDKYLLFEISYINSPERILEVIFAINVKGYTPLLAHPERYPFWFSKFDEYHRIKEAGALFQLNTNSLCGYYGLAVRKTAQRLIDENLIDFIGSDLHGSRHLNALHKTLDEKYLWKLAASGVKNASL
jgi:protein-tyrosine phosphatase